MFSLNSALLAVSIVFAGLYSGQQFLYAQSIPNAAASDETSAREKIVELIRTGKLALAEAAIEEQLAATPHDTDIHLLRRSLASNLLRTRKKEAGEKQLEKLMRFIFDNPQHSRPLLKFVPQLMLSHSAVQQNREPLAGELLDGAIRTLEPAVVESPSNSAYSGGLSSMISLKARSHAQKGQWPAAISLFNNELERLRARWRKAPTNPDRWVRLIFILRSAEETISLNESLDALPLTHERVNLLLECESRFPNSNVAITESFRDRLRRITDYEVLPETATAMYQTAREEIKTVIANSNIKQSLYPLQIEIDSQSQHFKRKNRRAEVVGTKIQPPVAQWLNVDSVDLRSTGQLQVWCFLPSAQITKSTDAGMLNEILSATPDTKACFFTNAPDDSFTRLPIINRAQHVTAEIQQQFRMKLKQDFADKGIQHPVGVLADTLSVADHFGIQVLPCAVLVDDTMCLEIFDGPEMLDLLKQRLAKQKTK